MKPTLISTIIAGLASLASVSAFATGTQARDESFDLDTETWANLKMQKPASGLWAISNDKGTVKPYWRPLNGSLDDVIQDYAEIDDISSGLVSRDGSPPRQVNIYTGNYCTNWAATLNDPVYDQCYYRVVSPTQWNSVWFSSGGTVGTLAILYSAGRCTTDEDVLYDFSGCVTTPGDPLTGLYFFSCIQQSACSS